MGQIKDSLVIEICCFPRADPEILKQWYRRVQEKGGGSDYYLFFPKFCMKLTKQFRHKGVKGVCNPLGSDIVKYSFILYKNVMYALA